MRGGALYFSFYPFNITRKNSSFENLTFVDNSATYGLLNLLFLNWNLIKRNDIASYGVVLSLVENASESTYSDYISSYNSENNRRILSSIYSNPST